MAADLKSQVQSLDREVTSMGRAQASMRAKLESHDDALTRIEHGVDSLLAAQAKPKPPVQIIAGLAAIATIVMVFGVFIEMRMAPTESLLAQMFTSGSETHRRVWDDLGDVEMKVATLVSDLSHEEGRLSHLDEMHHVTQARVTAAEILAAQTAATVEVLAGTARDKRMTGQMLEAFRGKAPGAD